MTAAVSLLYLVSGDPLLDWISRAGAIGILSFVVIAFLRNWIVTGAHYKEVCIERDRALELVYKQAEIAQRALEATEARR